MDYAVIRVGGKQHKVRDGETLVVDRVSTDVGGTFEPDVLLGDGTKVVVTVLAHERGPKKRAKAKEAEAAVETTEVEAAAVETTEVEAATVEATEVEATEVEAPE